MSEKSNKQERLALTALMLAALIWGSGFVATRLVMDAGFGIAWILIGRFFPITLLFAAIFHKDIRWVRQDLLWGGLAGFILFCGFALQILALEFTSPARDAFITATYVVIVPFISWLISKRRPGWPVFLSALLCLLGIGLLSFAGSTAAGSISGDLLTLLCAICFAGHFVLLERLVQQLALGQLLFMQMTVITLCSCLLLPFSRYNHLPAAGQPSAWLIGLTTLLYLALICTGLAYAIQTGAQKYTSSAKAALVLAAEALWGSLFSVLFAYEKVSWRLALGGFLIISAIVLSELPNLKKKAVTWTNSIRRPENGKNHLTRQR